MTNEFLLQDRIQKIQQIIGKYGEENFYVSFSGGKDSTVLSALVDMALPNNLIPRVYADTGIELNMVRDFVYELQKSDERIKIIKPRKNIKQMLEDEGYPFKSKDHSNKLCVYQNSGITKTYERYMNPPEDRKMYGRPQKLRYQFTPEFKLKVSKKCCDRLKKDPLHDWQKENNKPYGILGIMHDEGGQRLTSKCLAFQDNGELKNFQPLVVITKAWEEWFIKEYQIDICKIYLPPYNFDRTGCKGCPYNRHLQQHLDILEKFFPAEREQCEIIWKPVYDEYRRLHYRLKPVKGGRQMTLDEFIRG